MISLSDLGDNVSLKKIADYCNSNLLNLVARSNEDNSFNIAVSHYLQSLERNGMLLDLDLLKAFILKGSGNASRVALIMLLKHGNEAALYNSLQILNQIGDDSQGYLSNKVRILSLKLGIKIIKQENLYVAIN